MRITSAILLRLLPNFRETNAGRFNDAEIYYNVKYQNKTYAKPATRIESPALAFIVGIGDWTVDINYSLISQWSHQMISMTMPVLKGNVNIYIETRNKILGPSPIDSGIFIISSSKNYTSNLL